MKTSSNEIDANPLDIIFGGSKLWSQIVREAEKDVAADRKDKGSENFSGLDNIIKLINDNITDPDGIKINEEDANKLKESFKEPYKILKKELDAVRVLRVGKSAPEKLLAVGKSVGRFVGQLVISSVSTVGSSIDTAGKLIHFTPAAYILNRAPLISKKEQVTKIEDKGYYKKYNNKTKRSNFLEIIGKAIKEGATEASLKYGTSPIFAKVAVKSVREKSAAEDNDKQFSKLNIDQQLKTALTKIKLNSQDEKIIETITQALPNIRKGKSIQR